MKVLFIGGTGVISTSCSERCIQSGIDLYLLTRGKSVRPPPDGTTILLGNKKDKETLKNILLKHQFDVVVEWIAYKQSDVEDDYELFRDKIAQYIFISSASVYQKPLPRLPITEDIPLHNPEWEYAKSKIDCEEYLMNHYHRTGFPVTIIRPSHTYDKTRTPIRLDYTFLHRLKTGKKILMHDDGTSPWTLTHARDFAKGFIGLLGNNRALGESYHITSDEVLTWNQIAQILADKAHTEMNAAYVPAEFVIPYDAAWGKNLTWDKRYPGVFDNSKIRSMVLDYKASIPFEQGAEEIVEWYDSHPEYQIVDEAFDRMVDKIIAEYQS